MLCFLLSTENKDNCDEVKQKIFKTIVPFAANKKSNALSNTCRELTKIFFQVKQKLNTVFIVTSYYRMSNDKQIISPVRIFDLLLEKEIRCLIDLLCSYSLLVVNQCKIQEWLLCIFNEIILFMICTTALTSEIITKLYNFSGFFHPIRHLQPIRCCKSDIMYFVLSFQSCFKDTEQVRLFTVQLCITQLFKNQNISKVDLEVSLSCLSIVGLLVESAENGSITDLGRNNMFEKTLFNGYSYPHSLVLKN